MIRSPARKRRAVTLIELLVSMTVMSVLMTGLASALVIASRALPSDQSPVSLTLDAQYASEQIAGELFCAQSFSEETPTAVTFTVADRDADTVAETIRYAWSGIAGDPLTRQYNGGAIVNVIENAYEFNLTYEVATISGSPSVVSVGMALRVGADPSARVETAIPIPNHP